MKSNKGVTLMDVIVALIILSLFVGVIGSLFYKIVYNSNLINYNAIAAYFAVRVAEKVDEMPYDNLTKQKLTNEINNLIEDDNLDIPSTYSVSVDVKKYNSNDSSKLDILKIVLIDVNYSFFDRDFNYQIKKLKVREI